MSSLKNSIKLKDIAFYSTFDLKNSSFTKDKKDDKTNDTMYQS